MSILSFTLTIPQGSQDARFLWKGSTQVYSDILLFPGCKVFKAVLQNQPHIHILLAVCYYPPSSREFRIPPSKKPFFKLPKMKVPSLRVSAIAPCSLSVIEQSPFVCKHASFSGAIFVIQKPYCFIPCMRTGIERAIFLRKPPALSESSQRVRPE